MAGYLRLMGGVSKVAHGGKSLISVFQEFFGSISEILFWRWEWPLGYHPIAFWDFPDIF